MDAVAPIYPSHCPLHLASRLHRPGRGRRKSPTPDPQGRFGSTLQRCQLSLQVLLILKACYFACSSSSSTCWKGWLGWVDPPRQAESCWLLWMHVRPSLQGKRELQGGDGSVHHHHHHHHVLLLVPSICRLHQTGEKSRLHGCICSSKFLVAGDYCVKVSTTLGDAFGSFKWFCGCFPPPTLKGIVMVQDKMG